MNQAIRGAKAALWGVLVASFVGALGAGCSPADTAHPPVAEAFKELDAQPVEEAVARVHGREISQAELASYWARRARDSHRAGAPVPGREATLQALVDRELLVAEALKRGYSSRDILQNTRKRAMVRQLLAEEVEAPVQPEDLPDEALQEMVRAVQAQVGHPPGLQASHILVSVPFDEEKAPPKEELDRLYEEASAWLGTLRDDLPEAPVAHQLFATRDKYRDELPKPLSLHVNAHITFPIDAFLKDGEKNGVEYGRALPESWHPVVAPFGEAATEMAREGRLGELSDPVKTKFGLHLIVPEKLYPAQVGDAEQIRALARHRLLRQKRNERLVERAREWMETAETRVFPEVIAEAEQTNQ